LSTPHTTAEVMAAFIQQAGLPYIFGYPGDPIVEFMEAARQGGTEVVLARREGSAAFMAEAIGMLTGRPGVVLSTLGPGSTALVNGVAAATMDRAPMLAISGQIETRREPYFTHQVVDHGRLFAPITKWTARMEAGAAATIMRKALRTATAERPGAVHLTCAADTFKAEACDNEVVVPPLTADHATVQVLRPPGGDADPLRMLAGARRPVLLAGIGAVRAGATPALVRLAETAGIPVVVAPMAKGVFPEDHPLFAGVLDMACNQVLWDFLGGSDLILAAGFDGVELIKPWTLPTPVLHIDALPNTDQIYASDCELIGDIGAVLNWLAEECAVEPRWTETEVQAHRTRLRNAYYAGRVPDRLNPTDVIDAVRGAFPRDTVVTTDVGSHKLLVGQGWQTHEPRTALLTNGLSAMGFGLTSAIASALYDRARTTVALIGDGGFAMAATELRLAAELGLPLVVVVFVDHSLNRIELKQMAAGYPSTATRLEDTDLVAMAESMQCDGVRVSSPTELAKVLVGAARPQRPLVVEARIDPTQYESQF
jgi:acetolactate synthase I/II/III large subunit